MTRDDPYSLIADQLSGAVRYMLSVTDVEKLAKAGVQMSWKDIEGRVKPNEPQTFYHFDCTHLTDPLVERYRRATENLGAPVPPGLLSLPFFLSAWEDRAAGKVHVFVAGIGEPVILEDEAMLYPSDTLMGKLHMLVQTQRPAQPPNRLSGATPNIQGGGIEWNPALSKKYRSNQ